MYYKKDHFCPMRGLMSNKIFVSSWINLDLELD